MKRILAIMAIIMLAATAAQAQEKTVKEEIFEHIFTNLETAKNTTDYTEKLEAYSQVLLSRDLNIAYGKISCGDPELVDVDLTMLALQAELKKMYADLTAANQKPKISPAPYKPCDQVASASRIFKKQEELGLAGLTSRKVEPMPRTYTVSADVVKLFNDLFESSGSREKLEGLGTIVKVVYLSNEWKEHIMKDKEWPYTVRVHYQTIDVGVILDVEGEEGYRMYSCGPARLYDGSGKLSDRYTMKPGFCKLVDYKP